MLQLSGAWGRSAAFLVVHGVAALLLGLIVIVPAVNFLQEQRLRIEQSALTLERARAVLSRNETVANLSPEHLAVAASRFIQGQGEGSQNADLLRRLRSLAEEKGVQLSSATPLAPREWNARRFIGARIEFRAATEQVAGLLTEFESGSALLFIEKADLSPDKEGDAESLAVMIEIYGVARWPET